MNFELLMGRTAFVRIIFKTSMSQIKKMSNLYDDQSEQDRLVIEQLMEQNTVIFSQYFNEQGTVINPDKKVRDAAKKLFDECKGVAYPDEEFDTFIERVQKVKRKRVDCATQIEIETRNVDTQVMENLMDNSTQTDFRSNSALEDDRLCNNNYFDPMIRRTLPLNLTPTMRKRKEEFNALNFLMDKRVNQDYYPLTFQPEEDVQDLLTTIESCPDKKRLDLLAEGVLRKIAEHLETLNRVCNYRIMNVYYEKEIY